MTAALSRTAVLVPALMALMVVVRLAGITRESIWLDEAGSLRASQHGLAFVFTATARDTTPPLYFLGMHAWLSLLPATDAVIRGFSVLWSLAGGCALWGLARATGGRAAGLVALALLVVNPLDIYYAQEARMYAQAGAVATASSLLLWLWLRARADRRRGRWLGVAYASCAAALILTHYVGIAVLLAQGAFALALLAARRDARGAAGYCALALLCAALFLPWLAFVLLREGGLNTANFGWIRIPSAADHISYLWRDFFWGMSAAGNKWWPLSLAALASAGIVCAVDTARRAQTTVLHSGRWRRADILFLAWLVVGPALAAALLSWVYRPIYFRPRFSMLLLPPFLALCAVLLSRLGVPTIRAAAATILCAIMAWGSWSQFHTTTKTDWRELARAWRDKGPPGSIFFFPAYDYAPAMHYIRPPVPIVTRDSLARERAEMRESIASRAGQTVWICSRPDYTPAEPADAEYRDWLRGLGPVEAVPVRTNLRLESVRISSR